MPHLLQEMKSDLQRLHEKYDDLDKRLDELTIEVAIMKEPRSHDRQRLDSLRSKAWKRGEVAGLEGDAFGSTASESHPGYLLRRPKGFIAMLVALASAAASALGWWLVELLRGGP